MNATNKHGGRRPGAGRKSKATEQALAEKLQHMEPQALAALLSALKAGEAWAVRLFFEYQFGKPIQRTQLGIDANDQPQPTFTGFNFLPGGDGAGN